ncbi:hypothetical protein ALP87_02943 [Pseudomonas syringae pv. coriandricola]|nr:hypothetical protein ALP87_02943 [Pseudomonas syringae pv. coriandricola]
MSTPVKCVEVPKMSSAFAQNLTGIQLYDIALRISDKRHIRISERRSHQRAPALRVNIAYFCLQVIFNYMLSTIPAFGGDQRKFF